MANLTLNTGSNPKIDPTEVEKVYGYCLRSAERWAPYSRYITMTLHDHIAPAAEANKNTLQDFAQAVKNRVLLDHPSIEQFYRRNRAGWLKRLDCAILHRSRHVEEIRTITGEDFRFRECNLCSVVVETTPKVKR